VAGDLVLYDQRRGGRSYQSAHDPRLPFGLRDKKMADLIEIRWPSGLVDTLKNVPVNQTLTVKEGAGMVPRTYKRWTELPPSTNPK
jgi:hypothetical protein